MSDYYYLIAVRTWPTDKRTNDLSEFLKDNKIPYVVTTDFSPSSKHPLTKIAIDALCEQVRKL